MTGKSIVREIQNREHVAAMFRRNARAWQNDHLAEPVHAGVPQTAPWNLAFAPVRFETVAKPFGRLVRFLPAVIQTAMDVVAERGPKSDEGKVSINFLKSLDDEFVLQLGMLADCGEECLRLTRFLDSEDFDIARMPAHLDAFKRSVGTLFLEGRCFEVASTYTAMATKKLCEPQLLHWQGAPATTLGSIEGPSQFARRDTLARMQNWVRLAMEVLETEFPHWEILQCFSVFNVTTNIMPSDGRLESLAQYFDLPCEPLREEFSNYARFAATRLRDIPLVLDAWREAISMCSGNHRRSTAHPSFHLRRLLARLAVWTVSTSGVEQGFSRYKRIFGEQRHLAPENEERVIAILGSDVLHSTDALDKPSAKDLMARAAKLFREWFNVPRTPGKHLPHRQCRRPGSAPVTEKALLAARREAVDSEAVSQPQATRLAVEALEVAATVWSAAQRKEEERQQLVRFEMCEEATGDDPEYRARVAKRHKCWIATLRAKQKATQRQLPRFNPEFRVFLDTEKLTERTRAKCSGLNLRIATERGAADVIVVEDAASPGDRNLLVSMLTGAIIGTAGYLQNCGPAIRKRPRRAKKRLMLHRTFDAKLPRTAALIREVLLAAAEAPAASWQLVQPEELNNGAMGLVVLVGSAAEDGP